MAVDGCHKEYVEVWEIFVHVPRPAYANASLYARLCFGLLASSWLPNPLGIALWRALHVVMLVVGGPAFGALALLVSSLIIVCWYAFLTLYGGLCFASIAMGAVAVDLVLFVGRSMRFCWSVVSTLACHSIRDWRGAVWYTPDAWKELVVVPGAFADLFSVCVSCIRDSLYMENKDRMWESWARWWKEVVHAQGAVVL